jgi:ParB family chromosome partitioning protein
LQYEQEENVMAIKRGLGKGLDSLIPNSVDTKEPSQDVNKAVSPDTIVDINKLEPNRKQPRKNFDQESLLELSESIKQHGLIQPILVQDRGTFYEIVAGERRWRASKLAGLKEVPVIIRNFTEQEIVEIALIENLQRQDLNPIEEAMAYKRLMTEFNLKQDEVAERVSKNRATIANSIRLLKLSENVQQMVIDRDISESHARAILSVENPDEQYKIALKIFNDKMSVRDVEKYIKNLNKPPKEIKAVNETLIAIYNKLEEELKEKLGTKVSITSKGDDGSGKLEIEFYNHDDLERITDLLKEIKQ